MKIFVNGKIVRNFKLKPKNKRPKILSDKGFEIDEKRWNKEWIDKRAKVIDKDTVLVDGKYEIKIKDNPIEKLIMKTTGFNNSTFLKKRAINFVDCYDFEYEE